MGDDGMKINCAMKLRQFNNETTELITPKVLNTRILKKEMTLLFSHVITHDLNPSKKKGKQEFR